MLSILRELRARRFTPGVRALARQYAELPGEEAVSAWQLERFNERWREWSEHVPYFATLAEGGRLPVRFGSWAEIREALPPMTRHDLRQAGSRLHDQRRPADYQRMTGGSTAEPLQLAAWNSERTVSAATMWYARSWFGIGPADSLFLLWGHSHLLGSGIQGKINGLKRSVQDRILGYTRWSAYDLSEEALRRAGDRLLARRPDWLLGYSVALDRFARANRDRTDRFRNLNLKLALATAESFPFPDSATIVSEVLGCPVAMEYGAVETGVIAHQHPDEAGFRVMWQDHVIECDEKSGELLLTSLFRRASPLVRYRLGDVIAPLPGVDPCLSFERVTGRCNDSVLLPDGRSIHSEAFSHVVKECPGVRGFQVYQRRDGVIIFNYVLSGAQDGRTTAEIRRRLSGIDPMLRDIELKQVGKLEQTIAGKTRAVLCDVKFPPAAPSD